MGKPVCRIPVCHPSPHPPAPPHLPPSGSVKLSFMFPPTPQVSTNYQNKYLQSHLSSSLCVHAQFTQPLQKKKVLAASSSYANILVGDCHSNGDHFDVRVPLKGLVHLFTKTLKCGQTRSTLPTPPVSIACTLCSPTLSSQYNG